VSILANCQARSNPSRAGDDEARTSKKRKRAVAKGGQVRTRRSAKAAVESDGEEEDEEDADAGSEEDGSRGYNPSPTPAKSGAGSHVSPTRPQETVMANTLLVISSTAAKPVMDVRRKKKKGKVVQIGHGFSDSEGSDGPLLRRCCGAQVPVVGACLRHPLAMPKQRRVEVSQPQLLGRMALRTNGSM
jgi:hypothetical protein